MKIVVCGSEQPRCEEVQQLLRKALIARWPRPEIHLFTQRNAMLRAVSEIKYDAVFLFVESEEELDSARLLRQKDKKCALVFLSGSTEYGLEAFRLQAVHYLVDPQNLEGICEALGRCGIEPRLSPA